MVKGPAAMPSNVFTQTLWRHVRSLISSATLLAAIFWGGPTGASSITARASSETQAPRIPPSHLVIDWEHSGLSVPVAGLLGGISGPFFAQTADGLLRSEDGGLNWSAIELPQLPPDSRLLFLATHAGDRLVAYAEGPQTLYGFVEDEAEWVPILQGAGRSRLSSSGITVSPAPLMNLTNYWGIAVSAVDPHVAYVDFGGARLERRDDGSSFRYSRLDRSADAGATWDTLRAPASYPAPSSGIGFLCNDAVLLTFVHPTEPGRLLRASGCYAGRDYAFANRAFGPQVHETRDFGATWREIFHARAAFPVSVVGGQGLMPNRFFLLAALPEINARPRIQVYRSDSNGRSWQGVLEVTPGANPVDSFLAEFAVPDLRVFPGQLVLVYDPTLPDHVYLRACCSPDAWWMASHDGGSTWSTLEMPNVHSFAMREDGLYAGTDTGVWRLHLRSVAK